jgi:hypothetical protein
VPLGADRLTGAGHRGRRHREPIGQGAPALGRRHDRGRLRADRARRDRPLLRARPPGPVVRRGQHRRARALRARGDARVDPARGVDTAAVLHDRLGLGAGVRIWGGRAALAVGGRGCARDPGCLRRRDRARLPARRVDLRGLRRLQPVPDLVLTGGPLLRVAGAADRSGPARVRPRPARSDADAVGALGSGGGAVDGDPLLRGARDRAAGRAAVGGPPTSPHRSARGRDRRAVRARVDPVGDLPERRRQRRLDRDRALAAAPGADHPPVPDRHRRPRRARRSNTRRSRSCWRPWPC